MNDNQKYLSNRTNDMKKIMMFLMVLMGTGLFSFTSCAQQQKGIEFFEGSWAEVLAKSKETGKPIFVDVYTEWCGPCKMMAKEIFPLEEVGNKYNEAFINYKTDAEKGDGIAIAKQYKVNSYPTYLYIGIDGELIHRSGGFSPDPKNFISQAELALESAADPYTISKMTADFKNGKKDKEFIKLYIDKLTKLEMDNGQALDAYFLQLKTVELQYPENLNYLISKMNSTSSQAFDFIMQHIDKSKAKEVVSKPEDGYKIIGLIQEGSIAAMQAGQYEHAAKLIRYASGLKDMEGYDANFFEGLQLEYLDKTNRVTEMLNALKAFVKEEAVLSIEKIKKENKRGFDEFMQPYLTGERDSTTVEHFDKMKDYYSNQYQMRVASKLYTAANHMNNRVKDQAELKRALIWSKKAEQLFPDQQEYHDLSEKLLQKIK